MMIFFLVYEMMMVMVKWEKLSNFGDERERKVVEEKHLENVNQMMLTDEIFF